jgi:S1-C subfamily serine protease
MQVFKHHIFLFICMFSLFTILPLKASDLQPSSQDISQLKRGVVSINTHPRASAYNDTQDGTGTGFVVHRDDKEAIIVTNRHVVKAATYGTYDVIFFNGKETEAKIIYYDPWQDFCFLSIPTQEAPAESSTLKLSMENLKIDEPIFIIGSNGGREFSYQTGVLSSLYESVGVFPNQSVRYSINSQGGSSGSPVFNAKGEVIGINHSGDNKTSGFALPISYIVDAFESVKHKKTPPRKHPGMIVQYISLDKAIKYYNFPQENAKKYTQKYLHTFNQIIQVRHVFQDSPAFQQVLEGDFVLSVHDHEIGPNIYLMDKLFNTVPSNETKLTLVRNGEILDVQVNVFDLESTRLTKILRFGGALFYEADDFTRIQSGVRSGSLFVTNIESSSSFYKAFPSLNRNDNDRAFNVNIISIAGTEVRGLDDLILLIPKLKNQMSFFIKYRNFAASTGYDGNTSFNQAPALSEVTLLDHDFDCYLYTFDLMNRGWVMKRFNPQQEGQ